MKGSEFVQAFKDKGLAAWEAAAIDMARRDEGVVQWPMFPLNLTDGKHKAVLPVLTDYFAVGTPEDFVRLPLTPTAAQTIANLGGALLPTPKIAHEIWKAATTQLRPSPQENKGSNLVEYARHNQTIQSQLAGRAEPGLVTGHKKDVIVSNLYKPGKVLIYGWFWPNGVTPPSGFSQPIQARSNIHGDFYVDYSHGIRFISPVMLVDGVEMKTEDVMRDLELSKLVSDEGPVRMVRYPAPNQPAPYRPANKAQYQVLNDVFPRANTTSYADIGLAVLAQASVKKP